MDQGHDQIDGRPVQAWPGVATGELAATTAAEVMFSVVIPLYNKAAYIAATIDSVLAQTFQDFEVIVVDDGSNDGGAELVEAIADIRVKVVRQANAGVSAARNHGIDLARGQWVAFLDADDWHHPRYLQTLIEAQIACPAALTVAADYLQVPDADGAWPPSWPDIDNRPLDIELIDDLPSRYTAGPCIFTSAIAVRRRQLLLMQPCFPIGESRGEDWDMWFRLAEQSPIALVHTPLAAYRLGTAGSLSENRHVLMVEPFMRRMRERALSGNLSAKQRRSALQLLAHFDISMARQAIASGHRLEGLRWLLKGRMGVVRKRWWLTAVMAVLVPGQLVKSWESWRIRRTVKIPLHNRRA